MFGSAAVWTGGLTESTLTANTWDLDTILTVRSIGNSTNATILGVGRYTTTGGIVLMPNTTPTVGTGFDSTAAQTVDLFVTWGTASLSNSITLVSYSLESMN
jgi:hypothetical protein